MQRAAGGAKQYALVARGKCMPRAGILIDFMNTHIDFKARGKNMPDT